MSNYNNFVFYGSWRDTLEGFKEDFGEEYAREALWNLMTMATAGDVETNKKSIIGFVQGACMPNIEAAQDRYEKAIANGHKGGRPKHLSEEDNVIIATMRKEGRKQSEIATAFGVSVDTIRRCGGWQNWQNYTAKQQNLLLDTEITQQNLAKPGSKKHNLDIDIEKDIEKEKDKTRLASSFGSAEEWHNFVLAGGKIIDDIDEDEG